MQRVASPHIAIFAYDLDLWSLTPKSIEFISFPCITSLELTYKKVGPVSVLGRARKKTLRNVYGVGSPSIGPTSSSSRLHIYVPSHI